jgi:hypothetical protein
MAGGLFAMDRSYYFELGEYDSGMDTKDRVTRTPLKTGGALRCSRRVCSSCSTSGPRHINLVTNPVIN